MQGGSTIHLMWHSSYRYPRRDATKVVKLVEEYSDPNIAGAIGLQGEALILEGFARHEFVMRGRNSASYGGKKWESTEHNLDFIFERDGRAHGVEVKNTLGYMDFEVLQRKIIICKTLGLKPVFAARMLPKTWKHIVIKMEVSVWCLSINYIRGRTRDSQRELRRNWGCQWMHREHWPPQRWKGSCVGMRSCEFGFQITLKKV